MPNSDPSAICLLVPWAVLLNPVPVSATFHSSCACKTFISGWGCLKGSHLAEAHLEIYLQIGMLCKWAQQQDPLSILVFESRSIWFIIIFSIKGKTTKGNQRTHKVVRHRVPCLNFKKLCYCLANIYYSNYPHFVAREHRKKKSQNYVCR